jgi:hypothetical protein
MKIDNETKKVIDEGTRIEYFVKSNYWKDVKARLEKKLEILNSLDQIPLDTKDFKNEIKIRMGVVSVMREWIAEIEGVAIQNERTRKSFTEDNVIKYE